MVTTTPVDRGASHAVRIFHGAFEIFALYSRSLGPGVRYIMYPINPTNPSNIEITIATNTIICPQFFPHRPVREHVRGRAGVLPYSVYLNQLRKIDQLYSDENKWFTGSIQWNFYAVCRAFTAA